MDAGNNGLGARFRHTTRQGSRYSPAEVALRHEPPRRFFDMRHAGYEAFILQLLNYAVGSVVFDDSHIVGCL